MPKQKRSAKKVQEPEVSEDEVSEDEVSEDEVSEDEVSEDDSETDSETETEVIPKKTIPKKAAPKKTSRKKAAPKKAAPKKAAPKKAAPKKAAPKKAAPKKTSRKKAVVASDDVAPKRKAVKSDDKEPGKRYFKILIDTIKSQEGSPDIKEGTLSSGGGRYSGSNPMQAAKKAFTRIGRAATKGGECSYIFSMQETTQGSVKKVFTYRGVRKELETPTIIKKGGTEYKIRFDSNVKSYKGK